MPHPTRPQQTRRRTWPNDRGAPLQTRPAPWHPAITPPLPARSPFLGLPVVGAAGLVVVLVAKPCAAVWGDLTVGTGVPDAAFLGLFVLLFLLPLLPLALGLLGVAAVGVRDLSHGRTGKVRTVGIVVIVCFAPLQLLDTGWPWRAAIIGAVALSVWSLVGLAGRSAGGAPTR